jgi:hypothetical protein
VIPPPCESAASQYRVGLARFAPGRVFVFHGGVFGCSSRMNGKPSSPVLRGLGASNGARLLDPWDYFLLARKIGIRGGGHPPTPATPPCVRVRTRRFELVALGFIDQRRKAERFEVGVRKPHGEGFGPSEVPGATSAARRVVGEAGTNPERQQSCAATAWCPPLPPQSCSQSQPGRLTATSVAEATRNKVPRAKVLHSLPAP